MTFTVLSWNKDKLSVYDNNFKKTKKGGSNSKKLLLDFHQTDGL